MVHNSKRIVLPRINLISDNNNIGELDFAEKPLLVGSPKHPEMYSMQVDFKEGKQTSTECDPQSEPIFKDGWKKDDLKPGNHFFVVKEKEDYSSRIENFFHNTNNDEFDSPQITAKDSLFGKQDEGRQILVEVEKRFGRKMSDPQLSPTIISAETSELKEEPRRLSLVVARTTLETDESEAELIDDSTNRGQALKIEECAPPVKTTDTLQPIKLTVEDFQPVETAETYTLPSSETSPAESNEISVYERQYDTENGVHYLKKEEISPCLVDYNGNTLENPAMLNLEEDKDKEKEKENHKVIHLVNDDTIPIEAIPEAVIDRDEEESNPTKKRYNFNRNSYVNIEMDNDLSSEDADLKIGVDNFIKDEESDGNEVESKLKKLWRDMLKWKGISTEQECDKRKAINFEEFRAVLEYLKY